jgi:polysaccharide chain length determinant protein (PEP-CTERM system associated)
MDQLLDQLLAHLRGIWLRRFWGLAAAWLVAVAGIPVALLMSSKYEATAKVFVDTDSVLKPLMEGLAVQPNTSEQVQMLASTLMSRPNVDKLISLAGLDDSTEAKQDRNALIDSLIRGVVLKGSTRDNLFSLSYRHPDPARAKRVIESLLAIFVQSGVNNKRGDTEKALAFLEVQIKDYETVLSKAEERLKEFKLQNLDHLASAQDSVGAMLALDGDIEKARTELRVAEQRRDSLRAQLASEDPVFLSDRPDRLSGLPTPAGMDPLADLDARADALRRNLDELLRKYTDEHPDVVGTRRILADLQKQREAMVEERRRGGPAALGTARREPNLVYQQLKVALAQAEASVAELATRLSQLENRYNRIRAAAKLRPEFEAELAQLNRDYEIQKTNFEKLVQRREQAKLTGELGQSGSVDFRVIEPPRVSAHPVAPNRLLLILGTLVLSIGAGVGVSLVVNQAFPTVATIKELRAVAELSVLGSVSFQATPTMLRQRQRNTLAFAGGVTGLCALFGVALTVLFAAARMG